MPPRLLAWLILALATSGAFAFDLFFENIGKVPLQVHWQDPRNGKKNKVAVISPGEKHNENTNQGQLFIISAVQKDKKDAKVEPSKFLSEKEDTIVSCKAAKDKKGKRKVSCTSKAPESYYEIMGLTEDADDKAIKKAYRVLSVKFHPDKHPGHEKRFNEVRDAYEVLSDTESRIIYDHSGLKLLKSKGAADEQRSEGEDLELNFTLREAYTGADKALEVERRVVCRGCAENPHIRKDCGLCKKCPPGMGFERFQHQGMMFQRPVEVQSKENCRMVQEKLPIRIERGMSQFDIVDFKYMANQTPEMIPGHIQVYLQELDTPPFSRLGSSLVVQVEITVREALLGWERSITHLDGHIVRVSVTEVSRPGDVIVVKGEGMPVKDVPEDFGDLRLEVSVKFPSALTSADKEEVAAIQALKRDSVPLEL